MARCYSRDMIQASWLPTHLRQSLRITPVYQKYQNKQNDHCNQQLNIFFIANVSGNTKENHQQYLL